MGANIAGIYGAQIFRRDDRPLYRRGFSVAIAVLAAGLVMAIARWVDDLLQKRRKAADGPIATPSTHEDAISKGSNGQATPPPPPSDVQTQPIPRS